MTDEEFRKYVELMLTMCQDYLGHLGPKGITRATWTNNANGMLRNINEGSHALHDPRSNSS